MFRALQILTSRYDLAVPWAPISSSGSPVISAASTTRSIDAMPTRPSRSRISGPVDDDSSCGTAPPAALFLVLPFFEAFPFEADFRRLGLAVLPADLVFVFRVLLVAIVMFLPGVEKRANDHADRSTGPRTSSEVAEGRVSRRASIPETGEGFGTLAAVTAERIPARLPGGQRACSLTPLVMLLLCISCYRVVFISSRRSGPAAAKSIPRSPRGSFQKAVARPRASPRGIHPRSDGSWCF